MDQYGSGMWSAGEGSMLMEPRQLIARGVILSVFAGLAVLMHLSGIPWSVVIYLWGAVFALVGLVSWASYNY